MLSSPSSAQNKVPFTIAPQDRPSFHLAPRNGWINDPNGPLLYRNVYHIFYQYVPDSCKWDWGLGWGHAVSTDLVSWRHLPPALMPTPGGADAAGCFSGCATIDENGRPTILYTGVRLRSAGGPMPPPECDLGLQAIEVQLAAVADDPDDPFLVNWTKHDAPIVALPPPNLNLTAWRDPYLIGRPTDSHADGNWTMIIGAGFKDHAGSALVYKSKSLLAEWSYAGELCRGASGEGQPTIWECPLLLQPSVLPGKRPPAAVALPVEDSMSMLCKSSKHSGPVLSPTRNTAQHSSALLAHHTYEGLAPPSTILPAAVAASLFAPTGALQMDSTLLTMAASTWAAPACSSPRSVNIAGALTVDVSPSERSEAAAACGACFASIHAASPCITPRNTGACSASGTVAKSGITFSASGALRPHLEPHHVCELERLHMLVVCPNDCTHPAQYYLGTYNGRGEFDMGTSAGPFRLDLGDVLYAPNTLQDEEGRTILWGWMQERRPLAHTGDYAGCLSLPRMLWLDHGPCTKRANSAQRSEITAMPCSEASGGFLAAAVQDTVSANDSHPHLYQQPLPCLQKLRKLGSSWVYDAYALDSICGPAGKPLVVGGGELLTIPGVHGPFVELEVVLERGSNGSTGGPASMSGVMMHSYLAAQEGAAALLYCWDTGVLEVIFEAVDPETNEFSLAAPNVRRVGGPLLRPPAPGQPLKLHLFVDYSMIEVFTGEGEALATRVYRGVPPHDAEQPSCGLDVVSVGGDTVVSRLAAYELRSIWDEPATAAMSAFVVPATASMAMAAASP